MAHPLMWNIAQKLKNNKSQPYILTWSNDKTHCKYSRPLNNSGVRGVGHPTQSKICV